ncbi:MAG: hypothetical protein ABSG68_18085 [Thermoguttaceae bacterium]
MGRAKQRFGIGQLAGLFDETASAERDRLDSPGLATLLAAHRSQDHSAAAALIRGLRWLVYRALLVADRPGVRKRIFKSRCPVEGDLLRDDLQGPLYLWLVTAVGRLAQNDVPAEGVEGYVADELERCVLDHANAEEDSTLRPPSSTVATARREGRRLPGQTTVERLPLSEDDRGGAPNPHLAAGSDEVPVWDEADFEDLARDDPVLVEVLDHLRAGHTRRELPGLLNLTPHQVRMALTKIDERAQRWGPA